MDAPSDPILVGHISRAHGIRGEVVVEPTGDTTQLFESGARLWVGSELASYRVATARWAGNRWLIGFEAVTNRDAAERLRSMQLFVDASTLPELEEGSYYIHDLVGCRLEKADGEVLGTVQSVLLGGGQDLLEIEWDGGTGLLPMVREWLRFVDLESRRIVVDLPDGLLMATSAAIEESRGRAR